MKSFRYSRSLSLIAVPALVVALYPLAPARADDEYTFANGLYNSKLYSDAAKRLREFLQSKPTDPNAKLAAYQLGAAIYRTTSEGPVDWAGAAKAYEFALAKYPDPKLAAPARFELGDIYFQLKLYEKSLAAYTAFLQNGTAANPIAPAQAAEAYYWNGENLSALKRPAPAKAAYQKVLAAYPTSRMAPYAQYALGVLAADNNDNAGAAAAFQAVLAKYGSSDIAPESRLRLGDALLGQKKWTEARAAYAATLADPKAKDFETDARQGIADAAFGAKDWTIAATEYGKLTAAVPATDARRNPLQLRLADSFYNAGKWQPAIEAYEPLVQGGDAATRLRALYYSAGALRSAGKGTEAAARYRRVLGEFPKDPLASKAALRLGDVLADAKDTTGAAQAYKAVLTGYPGTPAAREAQEALVDLAGTAGNSKSTEAGLEEVLRSLPAGPASSNARLRLAQTAFEQEDWARTIKLATSALGAKPDAATAESATYLLARANLNSGQPTAAATAFRAQLQKYPKGKWSGYAGLGLTWALLDAKQYPQAQAAARTALGPKAAALKPDVRLPLQVALGEALWRGGKGKEAIPVLAAVEKSGSAEFAPQAALNGALALESIKAPAAAAKWGAYAALTTDASEKARGYLRQGLLLKTKNAAAGIAAFDRAIAAEPKGKLAARALYESAWAAHDAKNAGEGARWQRLANEYPESTYAADAAFQQGEAAYAAKNWTAAAEAYRTVTEKYPAGENVADAWYQLGASLYNAKEFAGAAAAFDKTATFPKNENALESLFWSGESWQSAGQPAPARAAYEKYVAAPGASPKLVLAARLGIGKSFAAANDWPRAITSYEAGLKGATGKAAAELEFRLGEALVAAGRETDAIEHFLKVTFSYGGSPWASQAQWNAAGLKEKAGKKTEATELYRSLSARTPADTYTAQAADKLKALGG